MRYLKNNIVNFAHKVHFLIKVTYCSYISHFGMQEEVEEIGIDWCGPAIIEDESMQITVPFIDVPLQPHELAVLNTVVDPLEECDNMGVGFYATTKQFVDFC